MEAETASTDTEGETKRERFVRLAERRTNSVIYRIRVLANCANPYVYEYGEADVEKIFSAIEEELRLARLKFRGRRPAFRLGEGGEGSRGQ